MSPSHARAALLDVLRGCLVGATCGLLAALFLSLLDRATSLREGEPRLVYALPLAGLLLGALYDRYGEPVRAGTNLVIERLVHGGPLLPLRLAPMVLLATVYTHLFGGSAGREGTAVQMGAGCADAWSRALGVAPEVRATMLSAGVAGGFGAVFGTPFAGVLFALELPIVGAASRRGLASKVVAALVGDLVVRLFGISHTAFRTVAPPSLSSWPRLLLLALAVALAAVTFVVLTAALKRLYARVSRLALRMAIGGATVLAAFLLVGSDVYLGLGVPTILRAFEDEALPPWTFAGKLVFTALTLSAGFVGGEVTPLFFMGATLGNALAAPLGLPLELAAALGLAAMFGSIAKTPLALSVMAMELFGAAIGPSALLVCTVAFVATGDYGIYAQRRSDEAVV